MTGRGRRGDEQLGLDLGELARVPRRPPSRTGNRESRRASEPALELRGLRYSAHELARLLNRPPPTPEQSTAIEAPVAPMLVVAGAGSGKTETMAARVVYLVANGLVAAEEVLGLTFTRKAAGELAERIRARLRALIRARVIPDGAMPTVATYHSYAAAVLADHGLRLGVEPNARLLSEAGAWQLAAVIVDAWDGDAADLDYAASTVIDAVLALAGECSEHLVEPGQVAGHVQELLERVVSLPAAAGGRRAAKPSAELLKLLGRLRARGPVTDMVARYLEVKRERHLLDFGDQVALAARLARDVPLIGEGERERFPVVLLDEYQDTSHAQVVLLRSLFRAGHPVTAVGDPNQSIYGWRGASAGNLERFPQDFPAPDGSPAVTSFLSTTWRNQTSVLAVANALSAPLRSPTDWTPTALQVPSLAPGPGAGPGRVLLEWHATLETEADSIADLVQREWQQGGSQRPTVAVLCRARAQFPVIEGALRARGLPVEVVGLGGLLHVPEVADVRAVLEVLHDPTRGDSLMRILAGAAYRIGPRDLEAFGVWTGQLTAAGEEGRSGAEALEDLPPPDWHGPAGQQLSEPGLIRLVRLRELLRRLRALLTRGPLSLAELVLEVETALGLDVEVAALPGVRAGRARAYLDAFAQVAAGFSDNGPGRTSGVSLGAFLAWLDAAQDREHGLEAPVSQPRADAVQLLTVHAAKGLEWDVVAVPGLVEGTFPVGHAGRPPGPSNGWLTSPGALPYALRGDSGELPRLRLGGVADQAGLADAIGLFRQQCGEHAVREERRLAYVAVTRARRTLLLSGAQWGDGSTPRGPSRFLVQARDVPGVSLGSWVGVAGEGALNPREALTASAQWPYDPLGERRVATAHGAELVLEQLQRLAESGPEQVGEDRLTTESTTEEDHWATEAGLLLAERDAVRAAGPEVELPAQLSASRVVRLADDPAALAASIRRPMPRPREVAARRGSAFHTWLEQRFGSAALLDVGELPGAADDDWEADVLAGEDLDALRDGFLSTPWGQRTPDFVEVAVETPVAGVVLRGRIDAVFRRDDGGWDVVDWKTGRPPPPARAAAAAVQLAVYRLAWARLQGLPLDRVGAAFVYPARGLTVRPVDLLDEGGLAELIGSAVAGSGTHDGVPAHQEVPASARSRSASIRSASPTTNSS